MLLLQVSGRETLGNRCGIERGDGDIRPQPLPIEDNAVVDPQGASAGVAGQVHGRDKDLRQPVFWSNEKLHGVAAILCERVAIFEETKDSDYVRGFDDNIAAIQSYL
jgi:hypothetical protein